MHSIITNMKPPSLQTTLLQGYSTRLLYVSALLHESLQLRIFVDAYYVIRLTCTQPAEQWDGQCLGEESHEVSWDPSICCKIEELGCSWGASEHGHYLEFVWACSRRWAHVWSTGYDGSLYCTGSLVWSGCCVGCQWFLGLVTSDCMNVAILTLATHVRQFGHPASLKEEIDKELLRIPEDVSPARRASVKFMKFSSSKHVLTGPNGIFFYFFCVFAIAYSRFKQTPEVLTAVSQGETPIVREIANLAQEVG